MAQDNEVYENIEAEHYTSLETTTHKGTTATVKSLGEGRAGAVHMTKVKWMIVLHVVTLVWCAALTGVIICNNIRPPTSDTAICENFFCANGGSCTVQGSSPKCVCAPDHTGKHCEINSEKTTEDACEKFPCANEGICIVKNQTPQCVCPTGFTGDLCQVNLGQLCTYHTCLNGGVCTVTENTTKAHCVCLQGFSGDYCETADDDIVVFNAVRVSDFGPVSADTIIPFDIVTLNIGEAYNPATGLFTTPVDGIYEISWSVRSHEAVWSHLRVNNRDEGQIGTTPARTASATRMLDLKKGDQVGAQLYYYRGTYGKTLYCNGHRACAFNGRLLTF